ncbi:MAG: tetratricopeptide repeat protein [Burkholderiales bacterium]|nr:tetratricopeptide repeat protein [Burkholderiales bacterium]
MKPGLALAILLLAALPAAAQTTAPDAAAPGPAPQAAPVPGAPDDKPRPPLDLAYGAFQRGLYLTAFNEASKRVAADPTDGAAMTLIGELYANGFGVRQDWAKAGDWYRLAVQRGDPHAAFALGMMTLDGRGVTKDAAAGRRLLESAADAVPAAAYNLALLLLEARRPESDRRAAELMRRAADAGEIDAQYALAVLYRQGKGVIRDPVEGAIWMARAAASRNAAAEVEYGIMLFNGEGVIRNEVGAAAFFLRAAEKGNPVAQNRLARLHAAGRGVPRDLVEAAKWHAIAGSRGVKDPWLDETVKELSPAERARADEAARRWLGD